MKVVGRSRIEKRAGFGGGLSVAEGGTRYHPRDWGLVLAKPDSGIARSPGGDSLEVALVELQVAVDATPTRGIALQIRRHLSRHRAIRASRSATSWKICCLPGKARRSSSAARAQRSLPKMLSNRRPSNFCDISFPHLVHHWVGAHLRALFTLPSASLQSTSGVRSGRGPPCTTSTSSSPSSPWAPPPSPSSTTSTR